MHRNAVNTVTDLCIRVGNIFRFQPAIDRLPCLAAVIRAKSASCLDGYENALRITAVQQDRVEAQPACARLP